MGSKDSAKKPPVAKPYQRPQLKAFGKLQDLTTGGTGHSTEPSAGKKPRP
jgi:hypothetical protein